jgi:hypothetical protein
MTPEQDALVQRTARLLHEDNPFLTEEEATIIVMWATHFASATPQGLRRFEDETRARAERGETWGKLSPNAQHVLADLCRRFHQEDRS